MEATQPTQRPASGRRQRHGEIKDALRDLRLQLTALNHQVSRRVEIRDADLDCLDVIDRQGPLSPTSLARQTGIHPATLTGVLDRLERGGFVFRDRAAGGDRRGVVIRSLRTRVAEMYRLYAGMNRAIDRVCDGYQEAELALVAEFLRRMSEIGATATAELAAGDDPH
ncbi:MAG: MarR family transcriptional regulator [Micromonosporaceae bacterium]|nr:MarR family transcriptional regulator [Micromonosporaceae bacterium]